MSLCPDLLRIYTGGADKSLARPTSRCILFDGENISFDVSLVIYINSTNIPPFMIITRIYEHQNLQTQGVSSPLRISNYNGLIINNGSQKHNYICKCNNLPTTCFGLIRPSLGWNTVSEEKLSV